ncbi:MULTISPECIES: ArnT family glycosyltransferase [unclassified Rathayibacter]|uniref:ArnT family glycosyltransferase n=1 Tax=unclassified Rathayibacter TaxID=2609250 RepID=UPI00188A1607|nr:MULTISPECIES: glycosyltransferase family 39 protein [unclassified Rathayibacter]MBF4462592.1 glycosyltransferase family 39 protein [Rathayibacter sp. VKM Ac-2879]MBF4503365.1 glycosyltransferase family 39 protein [Rathayibacter sp. VKM Ac-2878]
MTDSAPLPRWWREPWGARIGLVAILVAFAVLSGWNLAKGGDPAFYASAARSMSESWRALVFGAFDPSATVTLDKLSGFAVPQALSVRLFGMSTSSLALPQLIEGVVTVAACSVLGLRWGGRGVGLLAAGAAASTPIFVSMFGHPMEDGLLTMSLAVALVWWQRALLSARWWPLLLAGLFIGIGFQAKMMQAWFVVPALVVGTLVAVGGRRRALSWAGGLVAVAVACSLAWMVAIQAVPASVRPAIDGSTDDNVFAMVFGYNGADRLIAGAIPGSVVASVHGAGSAGLSPAKLLLAQYATQVGWLYPAAIAGIVLGARRWWPRRRSAEGRVSFAMLLALVVWLGCAATVLSLASVPHTAYVAAIGVQLALLAAFGWAEAVRLLGSARVWARAVLPLVLVVQSAWSARLAQVGLLPTVLAVPSAVLVGVGVVALVVVAVRGRGVRVRGAGVVAAVVLLVGPVAFSVQALDSARDGSGGDARVGASPLPSDAVASATFPVGPPDAWGGHGSLTAVETQLVAAARAAGGGAGGAPLFLTDSWAISAPIISETGANVLTDGGFSGQVQVFGRAEIATMIASARTRLLVVASTAGPNDPVRRATGASGCRQLQSWWSKGETGGEEHDSDERDAAEAAFTLWRCG